MHAHKFSDSQDIQLPLKLQLQQQSLQLPRTPEKTQLLEDPLEFNQTKKQTQDKCKIKKKENKIKKLKDNMKKYALSHQKALQAQPKVFSKSNKKSQIINQICKRYLENQIKDLDFFQNQLANFIRDNQNSDEDLQKLRQMKFIQNLLDALKMSCTKAKSQIYTIPAIIAKLFQRICMLEDNRKYILITNRMPQIFQLLLWSMHKGRSEIANQLLNVLIVLLRQSYVQTVNPRLRQSMIQFLLLSRIFPKLRSRIVNHVSERLPFYTLLRTLAFIQTLLKQFGVDKHPVYEINKKVQEQTQPLLQCDLCGIFSILQIYTHELQQLCNCNIYSLLIYSLSILNYFARLCLTHFLALVDGYEERVRRILVSIVRHINKFYQSSNEVKELYIEIVYFIGYSCYSQSFKLSSRELLQLLLEINTSVLVQNKLRDVLFPTLLLFCLQCKDNQKFVFQNIHSSYLIKFLKKHISKNQKEQDRALVQRKSQTHSRSSSINSSTTAKSGKGTLAPSAIRQLWMAEQNSLSRLQLRLQARKWQSLLASLECKQG